MSATLQLPLTIQGYIRTYRRLGINLFPLKPKTKDQFLTASWKEFQTRIVFIAVDTNPSKEGSADLASISRASESVAALSIQSRKRLTVAVKSTVPPGTTRNLVGRILAINSISNKTGLCANPRVFGGRIWIFKPE